MKGAYYCNCTWAWEAKGHVLKKNNFYLNTGIYRYQVVEVNKNHQCIHCMHAAFYSLTHPEEASTSRVRKTGREAKCS